MFGLFKQSSRIRVIEEELATLRRDFRTLEMDYNAFYDKARSMMQRIAKRAEVAEKLTAEREANGHDQDLNLNPVSESPATGRLTQRQREIQQAILRRRAGG